jgi:hypothetical protein
MKISKIFEAEGDGVQDDYALFSLTDEFLEAAQVLQETQPVRVNYWSATYYLLGHSAELMLKAFLFKHGLSIKELKNQPRLGKTGNARRRKWVARKSGAYSHHSFGKHI